MDTQECPVLMGSFGYQRDVMKFDGSYVFDPSKQRRLAYRLNFTDLTEEERVQVYKAEGQEHEYYSLYGFKIKLMRDLQPFILRVYLPTALLVVTSWISFAVSNKIFMMAAAY